MVIERVLATILCCGALLSCGGRQAVSPAGPSPSQPGAVVASAKSSHEGAPSRALIMRARLTHPEPSLKMATALLPRTLPPMLAEPRALLELGAGRAIGSLVALDRPIDVFVFEGEVRPVIVVRAEVRSGANAREVLGRSMRVTEREGGRLELAPHDDFTKGLGMATECELLPSDNGDQIACGTAHGAVERSLSLHIAPLESDRDLSISFDPASLKHDFMKGFTGSMEQERPEGSHSTSYLSGEQLGREMGNKAMTDLVADLGQIDIDVNLQGDAVAVALKMRLGDGRSLLTRVLGLGQAPGPVPAHFLRLARDADLAVFSRGADRASLEPIKKAFWEGYSDTLASESHLSPPRVEELKKRLNDLLLTGGGWGLAMGHDAVAAGKAIRGPLKKVTDPEERKRAVERAQNTWVIVSLDEPGESFVTKVKALAGLSAAELRISPAPAGLPSGSIRLDSIPHAKRKDKPKEKKESRYDHYLVVPDGDHVLLAVGEAGSDLLEHLKAAVGDGRGDRASSPKLNVEGLSKSQNLVAGGVLTLSGLTLDIDSVAAKDAAGALARLDYLRAVASKGKSRMVISVQAGVDSSPWMKIEETMTPDAFREIAGFFERFSDD